MTKDEEDALVQQFMPEKGTFPAISICLRLAIRAAVAVEQEKIAKLKKHADALARFTESTADIGEHLKAVAAYRAEFPKGTP